VQLVARQRPFDIDRCGDDQQLDIGILWQRGVEQQFRKRQSQQRLGSH
jgi:hypothetical protein